MPKKVARVDTESGIINRNFNEEAIYGKKTGDTPDLDQSEPDTFKTTEHRYFYENYVDHEESAIQPVAPSAFGNSDRDEEALF